MSLEQSTDHCSKVNQLYFTDLSRKHAPLPLRQGRLVQLGRTKCWGGNWLGRRLRSRSRCTSQGELGVQKQIPPSPLFTETDSQGARTSQTRTGQRPNASGSKKSGIRLGRREHAVADSQLQDGWRRYKRRLCL